MSVSNDFYSWGVDVQLNLRACAMGVLLRDSGHSVSVEDIVDLL